ncbi:hypothetical protein METBIDRAFT_40871 [Metschnikowia bicuspidata var. bicuspidata NRRL YB-4993]|uniref:Zn(2)-C6 fungal-type domain-containing protein n=1 Tax=Metschnikowia bicuspidata var. bicuspidata NRRL YB-4993 TaxID=869754 RepID=A0A1A0HCB3_9ASCO|nr:hypothetical protein METBIDRAFT_40871 [Metschnikowia bicuspidata var. bicuspidata NRRL YB-4993]OBA21543.1 hypothetical protein METBIDRAFT_40871 [Metschnikowia bicuspidata var. bicuspidata NRRL YB-4993]
MAPSSSTFSAGDPENILQAEAGTEPSQTKPRRRKKKVEKACVYCRRSHMICDSARPCLRCIKRGIGHLCHDEPASKQKKKATADFAGAAVLLDSQSTSSQIDPDQPAAILANQPMDSFRLEYAPTVELPSQFARTSVNPQAKAAGLNKALPFNQEPFFYSEHAGSEFSSLNDFLSIIDDPDLVNGALHDDHTHGDSLLPFLMNPDGGASTTNLNSLLQFSPASNTISAFAENTMNGGQMRQDPQVLPLNNTHLHVAETGVQPKALPVGAGDGVNNQPVISDSARDKFFLTAADPTTEISPEERLKQVIKAKLEAGLLQPYNYAKGYARLQSYMDNFMNQSSRQRILKPLLIFRPAFRAIAKTLKDVDLVLVEESFERMLLDYDRVFTSMAIPACLWRRTGEIYRGNKEFASLVGVITDDLKDGKLALYELMSEESAVNFWEKYGAIAFDKGQKAVLTSCNLRTKDGRKRKSCCFSFTIRRDRYNIPSCIVGNFIPIDP